MEWKQPVIDYVEKGGKRAVGGGKPAFEEYFPAHERAPALGEPYTA